MLQSWGTLPNSLQISSKVHQIPTEKGAAFGTFGIGPRCFALLANLGETPSECESGVKREVLTSSKAWSCVSSKTLCRKSTSLSLLSVRHWISSRLSRIWLTAPWAKQTAPQVPGHNNYTRAYNNQGCHSYKFSKFPDFSLTQHYFSLTG